MRSFLFCISIIFAAGFVHGETLVVRQEHPAASDQNPGTEARPLKTISAAAARVKAGDKVVIHQGNYREAVVVTASGTAEKPIVFEAAPNETPVIKGSDILTGWEREEGAIWKVKLSPFPPSGPDGKSVTFWNTNDVRQIILRDGAMADAQRLRRVTEQKAMEAGTFFCDPKALFLFVWLPDSKSPADQPIEVSRRGAWLSVFGQHITIRGLAMRHASTTAIAGWPACNLLGESVILENCTITWGDFGGVSLSGNRNQLRNCLIAFHGNSGVAGSGEGHLMESCRVVFNNLDRYNPNWHAGGAKLIPNFRRSKIRSNEFGNNLGPGLWLDDACDENVIDGNYAHDNEGPGIMVEVSRGNLVCNNLSIANRNFLSGPYRDASGKEETILNSEQRAGISRLVRVYHAGDGRGIYVSSAPETKVLNNTVYFNEAEGICVEGPPRGVMSTRGSVVMNNISVFNHGSQLTFPSSPEPKDALPIISDYNLLFSVGAVFAKSGWGGNPAWSITEWQKSSSQDAHSFDADPRFAMAAMNDFRPLPGSAALASGMPQPEVDHDFLGQPRSRDRVSIGAFEGSAKAYPIPAWTHLLSP